MVETRDRAKIEFIRSVVKELNYALNSRSVDSEVLVILFPNSIPGCSLNGDIFGQENVILNYPDDGGE